MAAINFPNSPSDGDTHTVGNTTWTWSNTASAWEARPDAVANTSVQAGSWTGANSTLRLTRADGSNLDIVMPNTSTTSSAFSGNTATFTRADSTTFTLDLSTLHGGKALVESPTGTFTITGNLVITGDITSQSDLRVKDNIVTITTAMDVVDQLRGVFYDKDQRRHLGLIAQEVEEVLPEAVYTSADSEQMKSIAYGNMIGLLIQAIKELKAEVERLKHDIQKQ